MGLKSRLDWRRRRRPRESVYFLTLHKCASSLFGGYVLKKAEGLRHVDYSSRIYRGEHVDEVSFEDTGCIYGPIRLSANVSWPTFQRVARPVSEIGFLRGRIAIFMVRDPRDILVSAYHSFGFTHGFSPVEQIRESEQKQRSRIRSMSVDEYALESAPGTASHFESIDRLSRACPRSVVLRYEDMIDDWDRFVRDLTRYVEIRKRVQARIYQESRPREMEDEASHRRSGQPGGFRRKLRGDTVASLNHTFAAVLERFGYAA